MTDSVYLVVVNPYGEQTDHFTIECETVEEMREVYRRERKHYYSHVAILCYEATEIKGE